MKDNVDRTGSTGLRANERPKGIFFTVFFKVPIILTVSIACATSGAILGGYLYVTRGLPTISELRNQDPRTIATAYRKGEESAGIPARKRITPVELSDIPEHVINAIIAAEDSRFFQHEPLDDSAIFPWLVRTVLNKLWGESISRSGYTIRQQAARTWFHWQVFSHRRIWSRTRAAIVADRLDRAWSKKRILYVYLNGVYLGDQCYGLESAAQYYFGRSVRNLTLAEGALVAGIAGRPAYYNPFRNKEKVHERRDWVLKNMLRHGFITDEQCKNALQEEIKLRKKSAKRSCSELKTYEEQNRARLETRLHAKSDYLRSSGG